jgi:hypothetical protein
MRRWVKFNYPMLHRWMRCGPGVVCIREPAYPKCQKKCDLTHNFGVRRTVYWKCHYCAQMSLLRAQPICKKMWCITYFFVSRTVQWKMSFSPEKLICHIWMWHIDLALAFSPWQVLVTIACDCSPPCRDIHITMLLSQNYVHVTFTFDCSLFPLMSTFFFHFY